MRNPGGSPLAPARSALAGTSGKWQAVPCPATLSRGSKDSGVQWRSSARASGAWLVATHPQSITVTGDPWADLHGRWLQPAGHTRPHIEHVVCPEQHVVRELHACAQPPHTAPPPVTGAAMQHVGHRRRSHRHPERHQIHGLRSRRAAGPDPNPNRHQHRWPPTAGHHAWGEPDGPVHMFRSDTASRIGVDWGCGRAAPAATSSRASRGSKAAARSGAPTALHSRQSCCSSCSTRSTW